MSFSLPSACGVLLQKGLAFSSLSGPHVFVAAVLARGFAASRGFLFWMRIGSKPHLSPSLVFLADMGGSSRKASSGQAASVSSASSSALWMGQGLGFGRVKRRASSPDHFLWEWSSRCGFSSASRRGRFRGEAWILASVFRRLSVPPVLLLEGQRCAALGGCCLEVCDSCRMPPLLFLLPLCLLVVQRGVGSFSFSLFLFGHWLFFGCAFAVTFG